MPWTWQQLGYQPEPFPAVTPYMPPRLDQPLMSGAVEEDERVPPALGALPGMDDTPGLPEACLQMPHATLEIGNRYCDDEVR